MHCRSRSYDDGGRRKGGAAGGWRVFTLKELHLATNNFNYDNKLGEGAFGSVYWGQLPDGSQVQLYCLHSAIFSCLFQVMAGMDVNINFGSW